ncbi:AAI domain-containing protein [Psidium guajava]|nr:AAI domain-containing protein [Psidium guajava]
MAISLTSTLKTSKLSLSLSPSLSTTPRPRPRITISCQSSANRSARENGPNYYELLSLNPNASAGDVKKAYRSLAPRYHPDVCRDPSTKEESTGMFLLVHEAYEALSDPRSRLLYDYELGLELDCILGITMQCRRQ